MTSREFHITARATATDWRWPPESVATGWRIERIVVTREARERLRRLRLHRRLAQPRRRVVRLAAEVHVLDDVEVVAEREILVDDLDPERAASFGPWIVTGWPSKTISPPSIGWMPATHLISVDLPAPLSPTSAMTSPARTSKSTSVSACTEPKRLRDPVELEERWSSRRRSCVMVQDGGGAPARAAPAA